MPQGETTHDILFDGQLHLIQPRNGFRATTDSLLLAAALNLGAGDHALEAGCGSGGALLPAAFHNRETRFSGVELDAQSTELARQGVEKNGFEARVRIDQADFVAWAGAHENAFDCVFSNPPYLTPGTTRTPAQRREKGFLETAKLEDWLKAMMFVTRHKGRMVVIHRAAELARILAAFDRWGGEICVMPIRPDAAAEATRILVSARKGLRRGRVRLLSGLALKDAAGQPSERLRAVEQGEGLAWR